MRHFISAALLAAFSLPTAASADWTGTYAGLAIGTVDAEIDFELSSRFTFSDSNMYGGFAGYQVQNGSVVYGGEVAISAAPDAELSSTEVLDPFTDLKGRIGYSFGDVLAYAVLGLSFGTYDESGDAFEGTGYNAGVGVDFMATDSVFVGAEYLVRRMSGDYPSGGATFDLDIDTFAVRVGYKF